MNHAMGYGLKLLVLFLFISFLYAIGIIFFTRGFLLTRLVIDEYSECSENINVHLFDRPQSSNIEGCWLKKRHAKAVIVIIDALRYDFALYDASISEHDALPYQNKLTVIRDVLESTPENGALFRFVADPPTTTMQRLKGLTTGSLPTFVDAGNNFAGSNIMEDNVISQLTSLGKNITFMGDDTWASLFPDSFHKSFPFPSFNLMDLHTVDNGVIAHLIPELKTNDWHVLIAHFLGVDHCGHKHGPDHPKMASKLRQMNDVLRSVIETLDDDTVLFVMGDHGMTRTGDHGGASDDEVDSALFVYSPKPLNTCAGTMNSTITISQIDWVPTFSLLLGIPIPFANLGTIIPDLFCQRAVSQSQVVTTNSKKHAIIRQVLDQIQRSAAFELNAQQVHKYLTQYTAVSGEIPRDTFQELEATLQKANAFLSETNHQLVKFGGRSKLTEKASMEDLENLKESFSNTERYFLAYLSEAKTLCRSLWAKFDFNLIFVGIFVLFIGIAVGVSARLEIDVHLAHMALITVVGLGVASVVTSFMSNFLVVVLSFFIGVLILGVCQSGLRRTIKSTHATARSFLIQLSVDGILALVLFFFQCASMFSNSFVVHEDKILCFFIQALVTIKCLQILWKSVVCENIKLNTRQNLKKSSKKENKKSSMKGILLKLSFAWLTFEFANRTAVLLRACREEHAVYCTPSEFLKPLSALTENASSTSHRFILSLLFTGMIPFSIWKWLLYQGNLNGRSFVVLSVKFALPASFVLMSVHWALQTLPQEMSSLFPEVNMWQQIILPQMVYWLCIATVACFVYSPLCIYTVIRGRRHSIDEAVQSLQGANDSFKMIHLLVKEVKQNWNDLNENGAKDHQNTPLVYGLATVYSSSLLVFFLAVAIPLMMLLGSGMSFSVVVICVQMFLLLEIQGICHDVRSRNGDIFGTEPSWSMVTLWYLLSSYYFYCTGHQATLPAIRFEAAFVGFPAGDVKSVVFPGLLVVLNTFAAPVLFAISLPLLLFWTQIPNRLLGTGNKTSRQSSKGEFDWIEAPDLLRTRLFRLILMYHTLHSIKFLAVCCSATLHRRHLMVWKIFAPRFVFEGVSFMVTTVVLATSFLAVLRVDQALRNWFKTLETSYEGKSKNR